MTEKTQKLEEKIAKRKARIQKLEDTLKEEKRLLKQEEENLAHVKYDALLKTLMKNNIAAEDILGKVEEVLIEKEVVSEDKTNDTDNETNTNNGAFKQY